MIVVIVPTLMTALADLSSQPVDLSTSAHLRSVAISLPKPLAQSLLSLIVLSYETYISLDAICRTLLRMWWTKRYLLEWTTARDSERRAEDSLVDTFHSMAIAPASSFGLLMVLSFISPSVMPIAGPMLGLWIAAQLSCGG